MITKFDFTTSKFDEDKINVTVCPSAIISSVLNGTGVEERWETTLGQG